MEKMYKVYESALNRTGHDPAFFPIVIPESNFTKEAGSKETGSGKNDSGRVGSGKIDSNTTGEAN